MLRAFPVGCDGFVFNTVICKNRAKSRAASGKTSARRGMG